jgi:hypothetical protein
MEWIFASSKRPKIVTTYFNYNVSKFANKDFNWYNAILFDVVLLEPEEKKFPITTII